VGGRKMKVETYRFNWKTFEEEMPKPHESILVRSSKETIRDAQWAFITSEKKMLYAHDMKWFRYISKCKKWLWCYDYEIERIEK
jgi:hypothetical protein